MEQTRTLVWIDLEMTGLDPQRDVILEIASVITDNNLDIIKEGPSFVVQASESDLACMSESVHVLHKPSGLIDAVHSSTVSLQQAADQTMDFLKQYAQPNSPLCGNSVWNDRNFLARAIPEIVDYLHYRIIDVSTIKDLVLRWYPNDPYVKFKKKETHRARADIYESIAELNHYRRYFFKREDG